MTKLKLHYLPIIYNHGMPMLSLNRLCLLILFLKTPLYSTAETKSISIENQDKSPISILVFNETRPRNKGITIPGPLDQTSLSPKNQHHYKKALAHVQQLNEVSHKETMTCPLEADSDQVCIIDESQNFCILELTKQIDNPTEYIYRNNHYYLKKLNKPTKKKTSLRNLLSRLSFCSPSNRN